MEPKYSWWVFKLYLRLQINMASFWVSMLVFGGVFIDSSFLFSREDTDKLVGGWTTPFEKYARHNGNPPQFSGWKIQNIWVATTQILSSVEVIQHIYSNHSLRRGYKKNPLATKTLGKVRSIRIFHHPLAYKNSNTNKKLIILVTSVKRFWPNKKRRGTTNFAPPSCYC